MNDAELTTMSYLLASMQKALLGEVTPDLRGVAVRLTDQGVHCRFIFDTEISVEIEERVDDIETEVIADYGGLTPVECRAEHSASNERPVLLDQEQWAYRRYEA